MLEERKSRKVGQTFSKLANEASTELHNANFSMQPNLSKIGSLGYTSQFSSNRISLIKFSVEQFHSQQTTWKL